MRNERREAAAIAEHLRNHFLNADETLPAGPRVRAEMLAGFVGGPANAMCECEECPECERMPLRCSGTACAATCSCTTCRYCYGRAILYETPI